MKSESVNSIEKKCVSVVVLGDFGRSPRMQYHTVSLSKNNFQVDVVAYKGAEPHKRIKNDENVNFHYMKNVPQWIECLPGLLRYGLKTVWQSFFLFWTLMNVSKINHIFLQNPPAVPTLPVVCFVCWLRNCCLVIDFHNYGYTILGLSAGKESFLVKIAKWCEKYCSLKACQSICVTKAMKEDLMQNWNVRASVFYDCAPDIFHPVSEEEKHKFFMRLSEDYVQFQAVLDNSNGEEATRFTKKEGEKYEVLNNRPALIVSSTSWTEDEDFSVLLSALEDYEKASKQMKDLPNLLVAITGKGPLKSYYERVIEAKGFSHVEVMTLWLESEDYPTFLACADLGVSLHNSSSGFDLPMKVVDMFGCCLPVCAFEFQCLHELVKDGEFGKIFSNSQQLSLQFQNLLHGFPAKKTDLNKFRENLTKYGRLQWDENWNFVVYPLLTEQCSHHGH